ncbi:MAG: hypothetical protein AABO41_23130 [Acidobacteriota bacterium]
MADETIRERYGFDEILQRIPANRGEFFVEFVPWPEDLDGWRRSARERFVESGNRVLLRTIWDNTEDHDSRVLIDVVECDSAADAVEALADILEGNQLAEVPKGPPTLGLASFQHPESVPPAVFFARGNLAVTVASFGRRPVDVSSVARRLEERLSERPSGLLQSLPLAAGLQGRVGEDVPLRFAGPLRKNEDWYLKFFATGGTIARRGGQLVARSTEAGTIDVEAFLVEPGREAQVGTSRITIQ